MTLSVSSQPDEDGQYLLKGVARNDDITARLGRRYFHDGPYWIGFDDNFAEPLIVRAYYDPAADPAALRELDHGLDCIGFLQFMQLAFRGTPIPPEVYGGKLADRQAYVYNEKQQFVDFMPPAQAALRNPPAQAPFYPYNALLVDDSLRTTADFCAAGLVNGSVYSRADYGSSQSVVASLVAEVAPGMATATDVSRLLTRGNLLVEIQPPGSGASAQEAYRIALDWLKQYPLPDSPEGTPPWLEDLDESAVAAQMIGNYVLLTLPDPEDLGGTLVIYTWQRPDGRENVLVHVLGEYDMAGMVAGAGREMLWRVSEYLAEHEVAGISEDRMVDEPSQVQGKRGLHGLTTPPFQPPPGEFVLELSYLAAPVGFRAATPTRSWERWPQFTGITWAVLFRFSEDTGLVTAAAIRQPEPVESFDVMTPLAWYQNALTTKIGTVDVSNFTKAAMRRENFRAGGKMIFVDSTVTPLPRQTET